MSSIETADVKQALSAYIDENTGKKITQGKTVRDVRVDGSSVEVDLVMLYPCASMHGKIAAELESLIIGMDGVEKAQVKTHGKYKEHYCCGLR